jgi:hypothetical protein
MPFGICSACDHYFVLDAVKSPRWNCPRCWQLLHEISREEALVHLRYVLEHPPPPPGPEAPTRSRSRKTCRTMVVPKRLDEKARGVTQWLAGPLTPTVVLITHQVTGQVLCRVAGNTLAGADLAMAGLTGADLLGADLRGANLRKALLCNANLAEANLAGARMDGAIVIGANLTHADLHGTDLSGTVLHSCDLTGARLDGRFVGSPLYDTNTRWPPTFDPPAAGAKLLTSTSVHRTPRRRNGKLRRRRHSSLA